MKKRIISLMLVLVMLISLMPAVVAETIEPPLQQPICAGGGSFADLQEIIDGAPDGSTIKLTGDYENRGSVDEKEGILLNGKTLTLDLNGWNLDAQNKSRVLHIKSGNISIINSSSSKLSMIKGGKVDKATDAAILLEENKTGTTTLYIKNVKICDNTGVDCSAVQMNSNVEVTLIDVEVSGNTCTGAKVDSDRPMHINKGTLLIGGASKIYGNVASSSNTPRDLGTHSTNVVIIKVDDKDDKDKIKLLSDGSEIWLYSTDKVKEGDTVPQKLGYNLTNENYMYFFVDGGYSVVLGSKDPYKGKYLIHMHGLWDYVQKEGCTDTIVVCCDNCSKYTDDLYSLELTLEKPEGCDASGKIVYTGEAVEAKLNDAQKSAWERIVLPNDKNAKIPPIEYYDNTGEKISAPTNVGTYTAKIVATSIEREGHPATTATATVTFEITPATPTIVSTSATDITYGQALSESTVTGVVNGADGNPIEGSFTWKDDTVKPAVSDSNGTEYDVVFTPTDTVNYNTVEGKVKLTVNKADPTYTAPTDLAATYGQTLNDVTLPAGFTWQDAGTTSVGNVGNNDFNVTFTPEDTDNYNVVNDIPVTVAVGKATLTVTANDKGIIYGEEAANAGVKYEGFVNDETESVLSGTLSYEYKDASDAGYTITSPVGTYKIIPSGLSSDNYNITFVNGTLTVGKKAIDKPTADTSTFTYSGSPLTYNPVGFNADTMDIDGNEKTDAGTYTVTVTPKANYVWSTEGDCEFTWVINKATPTITTSPTASAITYGQKVSDSALSDGVGSVEGSFAWESTDGNKAPAVSASGTKYTVVFTPEDTDNYNTASCEVAVTVNKATLTVTAKNKSIIYGEAAANAGVKYEGFVNDETESVLSGKLVYAYKVSNTETDYTITSPVGTYDIIPSGLSSDNYNITFVNGTLTVGSKKIDKPTADTSTFTYSGSPLTYNPVGFNADTMDIDDNEKTDAGTYTVTVTPKDNYVWSADGDCEFIWVIDKADSEVTTAPVKQDTTYSGEPQALVTEGSANGGTMKYSLDNSTWGTGIPTGTGAGTYTVYYKVFGDKNHNDTEAVSVSVTIAKADITPTVTIEGWTYGETASTPSVTGNSGNGNVTYEYKVKGALDGTYSADVPTNAGEYTVKAAVAGTANYNGATVYADFTIAKADSSCTAPTAKELTYNGNPQALVNEGIPTGGTMQYKLGEGEWGNTIPEATNAGDYTVYYKVVGDENHNDNAGGSVSVTIAKAAASYTAPTAKSGLTYTGNDIELINAGSTSCGTMKYSLDGEIWTENAADIKGKDAKTYTVFYKFNGDANHESSDVLSLEVTIGKSNSVLTTAPAAKTDLTCSTQAQKLVTEGAAQNGTVKYKLNNGEWSTSVPTAKTAGTYTVYYKVDGDTGYNDVAQSSVTVTISHKYDQQITTGHLYSAATCTDKAKYYYSCVCGKNGSETFEYGNALGHDFRNVRANKSGTSTLKTPATCEGDAVYNQACSRCGLIGGTPWNDTDSKLGHDYGDWQQHNDTQHKRVCNNDSRHIEYENHVGMDDLVCDICGYKTPAKQLDDAKKEAVEKLKKMLEIADAEKETRDKVNNIINEIEGITDAAQLEKVIELREKGLDMIHICRGSHKIVLREGTFSFDKDGKYVYTFTKVPGGWNISKNGVLISGPAGTVWTYENGMFKQKVTESVSRGWTILNILFGRLKVTNTYYLNASGGYSTDVTVLEIWESFSNKDHTPAYKSINSHQHSIYCYYCGKTLGIEECSFVDGACTVCHGQDASSISYVDMTVKTHTSNFLFFKLYTADIYVSSDIIGVKGVKYSTDENGLDYKTGTKVISTRPINSMIIVVEATDGLHAYKYNGKTGTVTNYDLLH